MTESSDASRTSESPTLTGVRPSGLHELGGLECWWRDRYDWLAERGYMLRPRYRPGWKPSWDAEDPKVFRLDHEDWYGAMVSLFPLSLAELAMAQVDIVLRFGRCARGRRQPCDAQASEQKLVPGGGRPTLVPPL